MIFIYIIMVVGGISMIGFGLWAVHCCSGRMEKIGAVLAPLGLIVALLGVLLICVPEFFFSS